MSEKGNDQAIEEEELIRPAAVYFKTLYLEDFYSFTGLNTLDLADEEGKPYQWTVILGNNNTGKTSVLRSLAWMRPEYVDFGPEFEESRSFYPKGKAGKKIHSSAYALSCNFSMISHKSDDFFSETFEVVPVDPINEDGFFLGMWGVVSGRLEEVIEYRNSTRVDFDDFQIFGYGTSRRMSEISLSESKEIDPVASLLSNNVQLLNVEEWLLQLDYAAKNEKPKAAVRLKKVKEVLTSEILPDIQDFKFTTNDDLKNFVEFKTDYGWVPLREIGYGYQATIAWVGDLAKRLFDLYPEDENPLHRPQVVLIDELDLHLHPEWQRKIISYLTNIFPNTQFIVTAHSPLIIQSAEKVNVVILEKDEDHINIRQPKDTDYRGWTVDEILTELMGLGERTLSDRYLELLKAFDEGLDEGNAEKTQKAYQELSQILHPTSSQRKILKIQMAGLSAE